MNDRGASAQPSRAQQSNASAPGGVPAVAPALRSSFIDRAAHAAAPIVRSWLSPEQIWNAAARRVDHAAQLVADAATNGEASLHDSNAASTSAAKLINTSCGSAIAALLRRHGDDPFWVIDVLAHNLDLDSPAALRAIVEAASREYELSVPRAIRFFRGAHEAPLHLGLPPARPDYFVLAGNVRELQQLPAPEGYDSVEVRAASDLSWYDKYTEAYAEFQRRAPDLRSFVVLETRQTLLSFMQQGVVAEVLVGGRWGGVVAAVRDDAFNLRGYRMVEEILSHEFRGKGLGTAMQRRFIDLLQPDHNGRAADYPIVFGRISAINPPSLATARRVGRVEVARWELIDLP
ncbi:MAG TPA: hypothetical protein VG797_10265 [Phycisphaerales bacterium]|nr:hypothetical protein [Phycisphaerales bacterium]